MKGQFGGQFWGVAPTSEQKLLDKIAAVLVSAGVPMPEADATNSDLIVDYISDLFDGRTVTVTAQDPQGIDFTDYTN